MAHVGKPGGRIGFPPRGEIYSGQLTGAAVYQSHAAGRSPTSLPTPAPNIALEPTPTAFARTSLRLLARLTAGVRRQRREGASTMDKSRRHLWSRLLLSTTL